MLKSPLLPSLLALLALAACRAPQPRPQPPPVAPPPVAAPPHVPQQRYLPAAWTDVPGWQADRVGEAWPAFLAGCNALRNRADWQEACGAARALPADAGEPAVRAFFETHFQPLRVTYDPQPGQVADTGLITSYYEPILRGARMRGGAYQTPLYAVPDDLLTIDLGDLYPALKGERVRGRVVGRKVVPYHDRAALNDPKLLQGKELVFVDGVFDAFLLQIQGSGRIQLPDGTMIRLGYADQNGHPYRAIARYLVERGELTVEEAAGPGLRLWLNAHPERLQEVLNANPSVVFFREEKITDPSIGPRGALAVPLTAGRSIAVDARLLPLGAPMFLATTAPDGRPLQRLVMAQDTGGAIRGFVRADYFWGSGPEAGVQASRMRQEGRLWLLWPKSRPLPVPNGAR